MSEDRIKQFLALSEPRGNVSALTQGAPPSERVRTFVRGLTLGTSDEIEAGIRAPFSERTYPQIRNEIRSDIDRYYEKSPGEAMGLELAGAAAPALFTRGASAPLSLSQLAGRGAAIGGAAGFGYSEGADAGEIARDTLFGSAGGALLNPAMTKGGEAIGKYMFRPAGAVVNWARSKFGDKPATAVEAELNRLAGDTGKSVDEIVEDVANGSIMAENRTLTAAVRAYKGEGGDAGAMITQKVPLRRAETRERAMRSLQSNLAPRVDDNVFKYMRATDEELGRLENEAYKSVFGTNQQVAPRINETLTNIVQRMPRVRNKLDEVYQIDETLAPLYKVDESGAVNFLRAPTLRDAEVARRTLRDSASETFRAGDGSLGTVYKEADNALKGQLDEIYPELAKVRAQAASRRQARDAFEDGRKALTMNIDELTVRVEDMLKSQKMQELDAFRMGAMDAIRNRMRRNQNLMTRMADPDRQEGAALRAIFPESKIDDAQQFLKIAADSDELYNKVMHNSMTAQTQQARQKIGSEGNLFEGFRALKGDPTALMSILNRRISASAPQNIADEDKVQIVKTLFSESPELVRKAMVDETAFTQLMDRTSALAAKLGRSARAAGVQQGPGRFSSDLFNYLGDGSGNQQ